jgi:ketosteroid isomerase-like protein
VTEQLPPAVQRVIEATNAGDGAAFVAAFTDDGVVDDWGRTFRGAAAIGRWDAAENTGARAHFRVEQVSLAGDTCTAVLEVSGGGFNGRSTFTFEVAGDRVRSMRISA